MCYQIKRNADKICEHIKVGISSPGSTIITKHRPFVLDKTWMLGMNQRNISISTAVIQEKAKSLFNFIRSVNEAFEFNASRGWFGKVKSRFGLHNLKLTGEAASADYEEVKKIPGYSLTQVFIVDETGF